MGLIAANPRETAALFKAQQLALAIDGGASAMSPDQSLLNLAGRVTGVDLNHRPDLPGQEFMVAIIQ